MTPKYILFIFALFCAPYVWAAETVNVRFGKHSEYERLVFEWPSSAPDYKLEKLEEGFTLNFPAGIVLDTSKISGADSVFIKEFKIQSPREVMVLLNVYDTLQDVKLGNKIIFDIYGDPEKALEAAIPQPSSEKQNIPEPLSPAPQVDEQSIENIEPASEGKDPPAAESTPESEKQTALADEIRSQISPPPQTILGKAQQNADETEPHAFVLSSTDGLRMTAYKRFGFLWILINSIDIPIEPFIEGENAEQFGALTRYEVADGTATLWQMNMPENFFITGEGGSLYWRIIFSTGFRENTITPSVPIKQNVQTNDVRSGQVFFPTTSEKSIVTFKDPLAGDTIKAVVVDTSEVYSDTTYEFVDFKALLSPVGLAFLQKNPSLDVTETAEGIIVKSDQGLVLTKPTDVSKVITEKSAPKAELDNQLFQFREWQMGPESALEENQRLLLSALRGKSQSGQAERLLTLSKLNLSHGRGVEAKGLAENASNILPQLERSPPFLALRGAASHLAGQHDLAIRDLAHPALDDYAEISFWKAATLAHLGDWQQAIETLPNNFSALYTYPDRISMPLTLTLTEIALRDGDTDKGEMLLAALEPKAGKLSESHQNGVKYLKGEILRQNNETEEAIAIWTKLSEEEDPLYRTKSELALVALGRSDETVSEKDAVNRLENLRFVWRGDDLELQVLRQLGLSEIEAEKYVDGFKTLRDTVVLSANNQLNDTVTNLMMETYENLFLTDKLEEVSPMDAAMLYEEFRELTPTGDKGDRLVARLAERLVDANLLGRAVKLLAYQLDYRLSGEDAINTALRMASIQIMDSRPEDALMTISKAEVLLNRADFPNKTLKQTDLNLLKARALSDAEDVSGALELLQNMAPPSNDIFRLEADIAWKSGRWNDAAAALRQLTLTSEFDTDDNLTEEEAQLLLNYAITLNLSDQRMTLRNIRERHLDQMQMTAKGELFEVITRPRQNALLADRGTIMNAIGETEIFSDFLDSYKTE